MLKTGSYFRAAVATMAVACAFSASGAPGLPNEPAEAEAIEDPEQVFFMFYIIDVDEINDQQQSFTVNFSLGLRWKDERLAHTDAAVRRMPLDEIWNPRILLVNRQSNVRTPMPDVVEVQPDGTVTFRQQYIGALSQRLDLSGFPLDTQDFNIHFVAVGFRPDQIEFIPEEIVLDDGAIVGGEMAEELSLPDWRVGHHEANARPLEIAGLLQVPGFAFEFTARRYFAYYFWQMVVPLTLIVMMSWVPFWVDPSKAELQFGIASSTVLTLIAFRFVSANFVPKLAYMTRLDYFTLCGTILVFISFVQVLVTSRLAQGDRHGLASKIDVWCRFVFPAVFGFSVHWSLLQ